MRTRGASSSTSDSTERVLNRSAAVINVNRRCRWYFSRFATTIDLRLFQQNRPGTDSRPSRSTAIFCRSLYFLRCGSDYVVRRQGTADALKRKFAHWLDGHGIFDRHEDTG